MTLLADTQKFLKDLILGDFEEQPGNAAMIVGGLISLVPVVDQIMDVRDVAGMLFRIGKKGAKNATRDDWIDCALAAFGCIPEVGSLFKTILKPLWKGKKALKLTPTLRGQLLIERMLGAGHGAAIKFLKGLNWAGNTQQAIDLALAALDNCVALLDTISRPHWWLPDDIEYLARDLKPQVEQARAPLLSGIRQGSQALQEFVKELLGEDALAVAQAAGRAASAIPAGRSANHASASSKQLSRRVKATPENKKAHQDHKPVADANRQDKSAGHGNVHYGKRSMRQMLDEIEFGPRGLVGEHMADYYHMKHVLRTEGAWPHGKVDGQWKSEYPRIVGPTLKGERPRELVPEDLAKVTMSGIDTIWQADASTFHFVEAKTSESAGSLYGMGQKKIRNGSIPTPPANINDRQLALWSLLGEPKKGTQMGEMWIKKSVSHQPMRTAKNMANRWVYLFLMIPSVGNHPFAKMRKDAKGLNLDTAPGVFEHIEAALEILAAEDHYAIALHDKHKIPSTKGVSETFTHEEIDWVAERRTAVKRQKSPQGESKDTNERATPPSKKRKKGQ